MCYTVMEWNWQAYENTFENNEKLSYEAKFAFFWQVAWYITISVCYFNPPKAHFI